jgi:hypothetical protein
MAPQFAKIQSCQAFAISTIALKPTFPTAVSSCVELTATQLLNSGWRSPSEACTAVARVRARHRKEISRTGGAKSRRSIFHVQRCCLMLFLREAKTQRLLHLVHACRGQAKRQGQVGKSRPSGESSCPAALVLLLFRSCMSIKCYDGAGPHTLSMSAGNEAVT